MVAGNFRTEWGVAWHCPWWHHLTFHFVHGNIFHLLGNILVLWLYCKSGRLRTKDWLTAFIVATAFSFVIPTNTPLVGFSGILMYLYGILIPPIWKDKRVRVATYIFIALSAVSLFFSQWPAVLFHALCIGAGVLAYHTQTLIHDYKDQEDRTNRRRDCA
jgi:membrane associated rhomboid family serine protease